MKISQEVREFAKLNTSPLDGESESAKQSGVRESSETALSAEALAKAGMAEMSKRFHDEGGEIYLPAAE